MSRNRFLGAFCLANANDVLNYGAVDVDLLRLVVNVLPFQSENLSSSQASGYGQQDESPLSDEKIRQQITDFVRREDVWGCSPFCTLSHPFNGVASARIVATPMVEQDTHYVPNLAIVIPAPGLGSSIAVLPQRTEWRSVQMNPIGARSTSSSNRRRSSFVEYEMREFRSASSR